MAALPLLSLRSPAHAALLVALGSGAALAAAWFFQLVVGLAPCPLCLDQRIPYYMALPLGLVTLAVLAAGKLRTGRVLLALLAVMMLGNFALAVFHAGVEWRFWAGPTSCTGAPVMVTGDILSAIKGANVPRCDEAAWRLFGLSMAGWNAIVTAALALIAGRAAATGRTL
ncbi:disulfide bond formation protein B [Xanthobacter variabilis]|uniref:disulfide bond formation protein B n=1 Tax=Xanthobacter variabilis TaxID=3119932 RepID=UPI003727364E